MRTRKTNHALFIRRSRDGDAGASDLARGIASDDHCSLHYREPHGRSHPAPALKTVTEYEQFLTPYRLQASTSSAPRGWD